MKQVTITIKATKDAIIASLKDFGAEQEIESLQTMIQDVIEAVDDPTASIKLTITNDEIIMVCAVSHENKLVQEHGYVFIRTTDGRTSIKFTRRQEATASADQKEVKKEKKSFFGFGFLRMKGRKSKVKATADDFLKAKDEFMQKAFSHLQAAQ